VVVRRMKCCGPNQAFYDVRRKGPAVTPKSDERSPWRSMERSEVHRQRLGRIAPRPVQAPRASYDQELTNGYDAGFQLHRRGMPRAWWASDETRKDPGHRRADDGPTFGATFVNNSFRRKRCRCLLSVYSALPKTPTSLRVSVPTRDVIFGPDNPHPLGIFNCSGT